MYTDWVAAQYAFRARLPVSAPIVLARWRGTPLTLSLQSAAQRSQNEDAYMNVNERIQHYKERACMRGMQGRTEEEGGAVQVLPSAGGVAVPGQQGIRHPRRLTFHAGAA